MCSRQSSVWKIWNADSFASEMVDEPIRRFLTQFRCDHVQRQLQRLHPPFSVFRPKPLTSFNFVWVSDCGLSRCLSPSGRNFSVCPDWSPIHARRVYFRTVRSVTPKRFASSRAVKLRAFAKPEIYEALEERTVKYAIRLPANDNLQRNITALLTRPVGWPSYKPVVRFKSFLSQAASWTTARRVVAKVEFHCGGGNHMSSEKRTNRRSISPAL
jgi:DDE family transposase